MFVRDVERLNTDCSMLSADFNPGDTPKYPQGYPEFSTGLRRILLGVTPRVSFAASCFAFSGADSSWSKRGIRDLDGA